MKTTLQLGEMVGYLSVLGDNDFNVTGRIVDVVQMGELFPEPMVKVEGKSGYVRARHCVRIPKEAGR